MKVFYKFTSSLRNLFKRFSLTDKCLLIFMTILMLQIVFNLFFNEVRSEDQNVIDIAIRTSAAAIFGYFIGNNRLYKKNNQTDLSENIKNSDEFTHNQSVYNNISKEEKKPEEYKNEYESKHETRDDQIIIVATIGIISLLVLIVARNFFTLNSSATASITELRDFISGSIGFLLGYQKKKNYGE